MLKKIIFLFFISTILVACGGKASKEETSASFKIFVGAVSDPNLNGGVMVYGREAAGETFAINVTSDALSFPIPNGSWSFYAFGWDGATPMTGALRCGEASANLDGGDAVVGLTLNDANCANGNYGAAVHKTGNQFKPLRLVHCTDISGAISGTSDCTGVLSGTRSYRVSFETFGSVPSPALSECVEDLGALSGITDTTLNLPTGGFFSNFLSVRVSAHKFSTCSGAPTKSFILNSGLEANYPDSVFYDDTSYNVLFVDAPAEVIIPTVAIEAMGARTLSTGGAFSINSAVEMGVQTQTITGGAFTFKVNREAATGKLRYLEGNNFQLNIGTK